MLKKSRSSNRSDHSFEGRIVAITQRFTACRNLRECECQGTVRGNEMVSNGTKDWSRLMCACVIVMRKDARTCLLPKQSTAPIHSEQDPFRDNNALKPPVAPSGRLRLHTLRQPQLRRDFYDQRHANIGKAEQAGGRYLARLISASFGLTSARLGK